MVGAEFPTAEIHRWTSALAGEVPGESGRRLWFSPISAQFIQRFRGKSECPLLGVSGRSISIKSDAVCKIGCRLSQMIASDVRPFLVPVETMI